MMDIEELGKEVIGAAIAVHRELGPGLLESTYEKCLVHEIVLRGVNAQRQKSQPIHYKGLLKLMRVTGLMFWWMKE